MFNFSKRILIGLILFLFLSALFGGFLSYKILKSKKADQLARQNAKAPEMTLTIVEGWNLEDIGSYLEQKNYMKKSDFLLSAKNFDANKFSILNFKPKNASLEGFLFPDTYRVLDPNSPKNYIGKDVDLGAVLIKKMLENFTQKLSSEMQKVKETDSIGIYEALILASIIEKETGRNAITLEQKQKLDSERKIVSGVFTNRLKIGMALESDATVNYVTKKNNPTPTSEDLSVESLFNTYKHKGLPPTPICNPSLSSILSAFYPSNTQYLYFLHKQPSGEVVFSRTFEEHVKNKFKYLK